jgi:hypothetical protein
VRRATTGASPGLTVPARLAPVQEPVRAGLAGATAGRLQILMLQMTIEETFCLFAHATKNILFFPENLCANIEYLDIHAKFYFDF